MPHDISGLTQAVQAYFDLMYDGDTARFDAVFQPTAQLHGLSRGQLAAIPVAQYRAMLEKTPSPKSQGAPRQEEVLLIDFASADQALVKLRVRIGQILYLDYLCFHQIAGRWLVTAKSFHIEKRYEAAPV